jgi:hypothetical protein
MQTQNNSRSQKRLLVVITLLIGIAACAVAIASKRHFWLNTRINSSTTRHTQLPQVILWAWERPESLAYLDSSRASVAFLARTIYLRQDRAVIRPRLQPLALPNSAAVIAVVRIEFDRAEPPSLSTEQLRQTAKAIAELSQLPRVVSVMVDYDATKSEREFYRQLLFELRKELPDSIGLSITALASWCGGDNWLEDLPIDEAVPMLFRMGVERNQFRSQVVAGEQFRSSKCQTSIGISTDEPIPGFQQTRRVYVFNPKSWSQTSVESLLKNYENK